MYRTQLHKFLKVIVLCYDLNSVGIHKANTRTSFRKINETLLS